MNPSDYAKQFTTAFPQRNDAGAELRRKRVAERKKRLDKILDPLYEAYPDGLPDEFYEALRNADSVRYDDEIEG